MESNYLGDKICCQSQRPGTEGNKVVHEYFFHTSSDTGMKILLEQVIL